MTYFGGQDNFIFKIVLLDGFTCRQIRLSNTHHPKHCCSQKTYVKSLILIETLKEVDELYRGIDILLLAHAPAILDAYAEFIRMAATELDVEFGGFSDPLIHQDKWRVAKSPFKYGKHKIEYMSRSYKKVTV